MDDMETNVKKYITSLLTSTPLLITMQELDKDYRNTIGEAIPYQKLGYNSLEHFLRSIPDTVQVKGVGPVAQVIPVILEKSAHINQLVTHQKVIKNKKKYGPSHRRIRAFFPSWCNQSINNLEKAPMPPKKMYYPSDKHLPLSSTYPPRHVDTQASKSQPNNLPRYPEIDKKPPPSSHVPQYDVTTKQTNLLGGAKTVDSNKLDENKLRNCSTSVPSEPKWTNNPTKVVGDLGRTTVEQLENSVPVQVRNNLRALIGQCPEGIWCAEVPEKYRKMFRRELNYQELGFKSLIHLCVCLSSIFHYARPSTEDYRLYDRSRPLPDCAEKTYTMASYGSNSNKFTHEMDPNSALPNIEWIDVKRFLPPDIFMLGEEIPRAFIPHDVRENDNIDIVVGEIYDLSKFWVYTADSMLDKLMDDLQEFYKEEAQDYLIPDHLVREGMYCVQVIFGEYHRALIVDTMPELEDTIRVIFIDYGTMTKVSTKGLCFLHVRFSRLEAQAIRCRLANVFPPEEGAPWSREACKAFRRLIVDRDVSAKISHINWDEQYLEIYLADVTNEDDIFYINDRLVEEGFARPPNKDKARPVVNPVYTPIVKFIHLFPTFLELEHGLAPSTAEMEVFNECDVPINFCYPQYFYTNYGPEEAVIAAAEAFHERHCFKGKRRSPSAQHFDLECLKNPELDLSIFGDLQWEIREFMNRPANEKGSDSNDEDFVDADEDLVENEAVDLNLPAEQRRALNSNGEETVNVLKRDLMVMEDIMKDINKICKIEAPYGGNSGDDREFILFEQLQGDDPGDFYSLKEELRDEEAHFTGNESIVSVDDANSTVIKRESLNTNGDLGSQAELSKHPLSAIVFDLPSEDENLCEISGYERKDRQLYTRNLIKEERKSGRSSDDELFIDVESNDREKTVDNIALLSQDKIVNCTNPFLRDLDATARAETDCVIKLHPNNPFLSYLQEDDKSSTASSTSTAYDSPVIATTQHSWTSFSDMSAETISLLGRSLRSNSSSSESLKTSNDHHSCSTQTADTQNRAVQVAEPYFCPARSQPPQGYPPWWAGGGGNPYYNVRFANFLSYTCEPQYGPRPPPPPGFFPQSRFPPVGGFPNMQYGLQRPPWEQSGPNSVRMPYLPPRFNPTNSQGANNAACLPGSVSSDCVSTVRENRDFYELYNEELRLRMNYNGGQ